ncbi:MAG: M20/M25/M40 family metallo-hydrolase [Pirellulales bacterium]|nr:M20/M25/M40 family metallo-hydrolase [Pirellulales bacterium]
MPIDRQAIRTAVADLMPSATDFLCRLIAFPSTSGKEHDLLCWAETQFRELGLEVRRIPLSDAIREDEDYSSPVPDIRYDGRFNLRLCLPGSGGGKRLLLNSHVDVVPPSQGQENPWQAIHRDGVLYGRGACDAKGQVATIYLVFAALKRLGVKLPGDVIAHVVNEEENGGNGSLAMVRAGEAADACIVLEPSTNKIFSSVRGAVWFRILCQGKAGHSGRAGDTVSALALARKAMDRFEKYHDDLLAASRGIPLFDKYENPMPITFGRCIAGDWPATAPARAVVEGVLGLLPNKTRYQVMDEMRAVLDQSGDPRLRERVALEFMYRHDSHVLDPQHPLVECLQRRCLDWELPVEVDALTASCDSWFYNNQLGIPTVVYGPGTLRYAHSNEEQIALAEIAQAACVLTDFAASWCG